MEQSGQRVGRLTLIKKIRQSGRAAWICHCECGNTKVILQQSIRSGATGSCGCFGRESRLKAQTKHGMTGSRVWWAWWNMQQRCFNLNGHEYHNYGGRGISVCDRWRTSFANFLADMGEPPAGMSLDRIDVNGDYEPGNCRWATAKEQARNMRTNRIVRAEGKSLCVSEWAELIGVPKHRIQTRVGTMPDAEVIRRARQSAS